MFESLILGAVQGIAEWLPVSSEAMVVLVKSNFFGGGSFSDLINLAIFLHLGTLLSVAFYYRTKLITLVRQFFHYQSLDTSDRRTLNFLAIATVISGILGILLLKVIEANEHLFSNQVVVNLSVSGFLFLTALLLFISEKNSNKIPAPLSAGRAIITGLFQGLAAIPGVSRSGSTVAGMGIIGINKEQALELSFLLSIPIVLGANIILNLDTVNILGISELVALASAFVFGLLTIDILLKVVRRVRFSSFVAVFACILLIATIMVQ